MKRFGLLLGGIVLLGAGCTGQPDTAAIVEPEFVTPEPVEPKQIEEGSLSHPGVLPAEDIENKRIRIETEKGDVVFELFADTAPKTVSNFVYLTNQDFYDDLIFHRYEPGFVIQGGDPEGTGRGGPGYAFEDELDDDYSYDRGIVAMANSGPDTNGSQFFILLEDNEQLSKDYSIFGRVVEGMDVVDRLRAGDKMTDVEVEPRQE